jgi:hypothetical protein
MTVIPGECPEIPSSERGVQLLIRFLSFESVLLATPVIDRLGVEAPITADLEGRQFAEL